MVRTASVGSSLLGLACLAALATCRSAKTVDLADILPPPPTPQLDVQVDSGRVSLNAVAVSREEVVRRLAREAELELVIAESLPQKVTLRLRDAPLDDVLRLLLAGRNYVITYAADGTPRTVVVRPSGAWQ